MYKIIIKKQNTIFFLCQDELAFSGQLFNKKGVPIMFLEIGNMCVYSYTGVQSPLVYRH